MMMRPMMGLGQMPGYYGAPSIGQLQGIHPAVLAQLQQMHGLFGMQPQPQQGLGYPHMGIQPLSPASVGSLR